MDFKLTKEIISQVANEDGLYAVHAIFTTQDRSFYLDFTVSKELLNDEKAKEQFYNANAKRFLLKNSLIK